MAAKAGWVERQAGLWNFWHRWWLVLEPSPPRPEAHGHHVNTSWRLTFYPVEDTENLGDEQMRWSRERALDLADISGLQLCGGADATGQDVQIELLSSAAPSGAHRFRFTGAEERKQWVAALSEVFVSLQTHIRYRVIKQRDIFEHRRQDIHSASSAFGLSHSGAAIAMARFRWNFQSARAKFDECGCEPEAFAHALDIDFDAAEVVEHGNDGDIIQCPVLLHGTTEWTGLSCGCKFADEAWMEYIQLAIRNASIAGLKCPSPGCNVPVPEQLILHFAGEFRDKYFLFAGRSWVLDQRALGRLALCPAGCGNAIAAEHDETMTTVVCACGHEFCFSCQQQAHAPASCEEFAARTNLSHPETQLYLDAFCKMCPTKAMVDQWEERLTAQGIEVISITDASHPQTFGCGRYIFREGGSNHIWTCSCDFHWCWECQGPYFAQVRDATGREGQYHTDGWYVCGNCDQAANNRKKAARAVKLTNMHSSSLLMAALQRLAWSKCYHGRLGGTCCVVKNLPLNLAEIVARQFEVTFIIGTHAAWGRFVGSGVGLTTSAHTPRLTHFLKRAENVLVKGRQMLKYYNIRHTAILERRSGVPMPTDSGTESALFKMAMDPFASAVEDLSDLLAQLSCDPALVDQAAASTSPPSTEDLPLTFGDGLMGLSITSVDASGHAISHSDAPCDHIVLSAKSPGTPADACPQLQCGMVVKAIQGTPLRGLSFNQVAQMLRSAPRPVTIVFGRTADAGGTGTIDRKQQVSSLALTVNFYSSTAVVEALRRWGAMPAQKDLLRAIRPLQRLLLPMLSPLLPTDDIMDYIRAHLEASVMLPSHLASLYSSAFEVDAGLALMLFKTSSPLPEFAWHWQH
jgi:hypothetical protein